MVSKIVIEKGNNKKLHKWKVIALASFVAIGIVIVCLGVFLLYGDSYINKYFKYRIIKEFTSAYPGYSIKISDLHFNMFVNNIELGTLDVHSNDSSFSGSIDRLSLRGISWLQLLWRGTLVPDAIVSSSAEAEKIVLKFVKSQYEVRCGLLNVSLHDSKILANDLELHPLVDDDHFFEESEFRKTRFRMVLPKLMANGMDCIGMLQGKIYHTSFIQISDVSIDALVNMQKPYNSDTTKILIPNDVLDSIKDKIKIDSLSFLDGYIKYVESYSGPSNPDVGYECRYSSLHVSLKDSEVVVNDLEIKPLVEENQFFNESKYRRTRFSMVLPRLKASGLDYNGLLNGDIYNARMIQISDASLDVLVNMYKPYKRDTVKTPMPNEMMSFAKGIIQLDSISILNSKIKYSESYAARSKPGIITIYSLNALIKGISNNNKNGDTAVLEASAFLMGAAMSKLIMHVPLKSPKFNMHFSGSLGSMKMEKINAFLEIAEHTRIKSGIINSVNYDINVKDGIARGYVRGIYKDFTLALLDKNRSEKGLGNRITSFIANTFKIHGTNKKDESGSLKLGKVSYSRKRDDTFIQVAWFGVRSGAGDMLNIKMK